MGQYSIAGSSSIHQSTISNSKLVNLFYEMNHKQLFWFQQGENYHRIRIEFIKILRNASLRGLDKSRYNYSAIFKFEEASSANKDSAEFEMADRLFTDVALLISKDLYQGFDIDKIISYDEISKKYQEADGLFILNKLLKVNSPETLVSFFNSLEPNSKEYQLLKNELGNVLKGRNEFRARQLESSMNFYHWIHHFRFDRYIIINIGSATLRYFENDSLQLSMKAVVGKISTKTPRFAAYLNEVILYPYWNIPLSIVYNELLLKFKKNPHYVKTLNMQLLNLSGKLVDPNSLNWNLFSRTYFPFHLRQSAGCDNSLGVIKFNLTSPYIIYLHDTNDKASFQSGYRYYSHGCIRLEYPYELANKISNNKIDKRYLESCLKDQLPKSIELKNPVPVFIVYMTVEANMLNKPVYFKDVYKLLGVEK